MPRAGLTARVGHGGRRRAGRRRGPRRGHARGARGAASACAPPSLYAHVDGLEDLRARARRAGRRAARRARCRRRSPGAPAAQALRRRRRGLPRLRARAPRRLRRAAARAGPQRAGRARRPSGRSRWCSPCSPGYGLEGEEALHATRAIRSALHGFVLLEAQRGVRPRARRRRELRGARRACSTAGSAVRGARRQRGLRPAA